MNTVKQQIRQPVRFLSGILLTAMGVTILCVCMGQSIASGRTERAMDDLFFTIALPTIKYSYSEPKVIKLPDDTVISLTTFTRTLPDPVRDMIQELSQTRPDLVKCVTRHGLASAYIPELNVDNRSRHRYYAPLTGTRTAVDIRKLEAADTCACAMLEIRLDGITLGNESADPLAVELKGTVLSVVSLEAGYDDPVGRKLWLNLTLPDKETLASLNLTPGERYLVSGTDYLDGDWVLWSGIANTLSYRLGHNVEPDTLKESSLSYNTQILNQAKMFANAGVEAGEYTYEGKIVRLYDYEIINLHSVSMSAGGCPAILRLEGTVEAFLASEAGREWAEQRDRMQINYHAFPIIGVDDLGYVADFARGFAKIVRGRDFTQKELDTGAKVCVLSETLAAENGLTVGDTIHPRFYNYDYANPDQRFLKDGVGLVNPAAYTFTANTPWAGEAEGYTIVGLYRQDNAWCDVGENLYSFTPNTIFAPKTSVTSNMDYGDYGFYQTIVLQNGAVEEFRDLFDMADYQDLFVYYDQGYTEVAGNLYDYREAAKLALTVGIVVYGVMMALFLVFYPGNQGSTLLTMQALGAGRGTRIAHVLLCGAEILLPGTAIGTVCGMLLWERIVGMIAAAVGSELTLNMEAGTVAAIGLSQLVLMLAATGILTIPMTRPRGLKKRK